MLPALAVHHVRHPKMGEQNRVGAGVLGGGPGYNLDYITMLDYLLTSS